MSQAADPKLLEALGRASSLQLFQLQSIIERMLADPKRIIAVRLNMHVGQTVRFLDWRDGQMRSGKVLQIRDTQAVIHEASTLREWKLPYAAIEPPPAGAAPARPAATEPSTAPLPQREDFRCGDKVAFEDKHLNTVVGTIVRINQPTASIDPGDGTTWRVGFTLLRRVIDI